MRTATKGFTLVEIMIVVAIVGVGAGIALVNMSDQVAEARAQADGDAMAQRIQVEQRAARERMVGMRLTKNVDQLDFEDVSDCSQPGANIRHHKHLSTTELAISPTATSVCWDRNGQVAAATVTVSALHPKGKATPELEVKGGIKRIRTRKLRTTLAGPLSAIVDNAAIPAND